MKLYGDCDHCPEVKEGERASFVSATVCKMIGDYNANLCVPCRNEFHLYITATHEWRVLRDLSVEYYVQVERGELGAAISVSSQLDKARAAAWKLSKHWVEGNK